MALYFELQAREREAAPRWFDNDAFLRDLAVVDRRGNDDGGTFELDAVVSPCVLVAICCMLHHDASAQAWRRRPASRRLWLKFAFDPPNELLEHSVVTPVPVLACALRPAADC